MKNKIPTLCLAILALFLSRSAWAQQVNYQFAPAPIPYPSFEPQRTDFKITGAYSSLSGPGISLSGGGAVLGARYAFSEQLAGDLQFAAGGMSGKIPGFALPFIFGGNIWSPVIDGDGDLSGGVMGMAGNLEVQVVHTPRLSMILFGGPNMMFSPLTLQTPYHARSGVTNAARTTFTTEAMAVLGGIQAGIQLGIPAGPFEFVPYGMVAMESGSASFTFKNGYRDTDPLIEDAVADIEPFSIATIGGDIIYKPWGLSFGTLMQSTPTKKTQNGYTTVLMTLSWHFRKS